MTHKFYSKHLKHILGLPHVTGDELLQLLRKGQALDSFQLDIACEEVARSCWCGVRQVWNRRPPLTRWTNVSSKVGLQGSIPMCLLSKSIATFHVQFLA
jgi:hypothetical protein